MPTNVSRRPDPRVLDAAFDAHPERFVRGRPLAKRPPPVVHINPPLGALDAPPSTPAEEFLVMPDIVLANPAETHGTIAVIALPGLERTSSLPS
jgi:hypothetical protein